MIDFREVKNENTIQDLMEIEKNKKRTREEKNDKDKNQEKSRKILSPNLDEVINVLENIPEQIYLLVAKLKAKINADVLPPVIQAFDWRDYDQGRYQIIIKLNSLKDDSYLNDSLLKDKIISSASKLFDRLQALNEMQATDPDGLLKRVPVIVIILEKLREIDKAVSDIFKVGETIALLTNIVAYLNKESREIRKETLQALANWKAPCPKLFLLYTDENNYGGYAQQVKELISQMQTLVEGKEEEIQTPQLKKQKWKAIKKAAAKDLDTISLKEKEQKTREDEALNELVEAHKKEKQEMGDELTASLSAEEKAWMRSDRGILRRINNNKSTDEDRAQPSFSFFYERRKYLTIVKDDEPLADTDISLRNT